MEMKVITNNKPRSFIGWSDIPKKVKETEFDYIQSIGNGKNRDFIKYKGNYYDLAEFMKIDRNSELFIKYGFTGIHGDTFFSATLVKVTKDNDSVIIGRVYT